MGYEWKVTNDFGEESPACLCVKEEFNKAFIKRDGCCDITAYKDDEHKEEDFSIHICDIPEFIKMLQSLEDFRMNNIDGAE